MMSAFPQGRLAVHETLVRLAGPTAYYADRLELVDDLGDARSVGSARTAAAENPYRSGQHDPDARLHLPGPATDPIVQELHFVDGDDCRCPAGRLAPPHAKESTGSASTVPPSCCFTVYSPA